MDFAHLFQGPEIPDEGQDPVKKILEEIDTQAYFSEAILGELDGSSSPTILAMWWEARDAYIASAKLLIDLDPFVSDEGKERFLRAQHEARRFFDMILWLEKHARKYRRAQEMSQEHEMRRIRSEQEANERTTD